MTGTRRLKREIRGLLGDLGGSRSEVAAALQELGIRASPQDSQSCAVAVYLKAVVGADPCIRSVDVLPRHVRAVTKSQGPIPWSFIVRVPLPRSVSEFIIAFDHETYPTLVRPESRQRDRTDHPGAGGGPASGATHDASGSDHESGASATT